jgi:hypothetical protein
LASTLGTCTERIPLELVDSGTHLTKGLAKPHFLLPGHSVLGDRDSAHDQNSQNTKSANQFQQAEAAFDISDLDGYSYHQNSYF